MNNKSIISKNKNLALTGAFTALVLVLGITSLGFIRIGILSITILQIPVILAVLLVNLPSGLFVGTAFGVMSLVQAAISSAGIDYCFLNPICSVLPRILFVLITWFVWRLLNSIPKMPKVISATITAIISSISHTLLVMGTVFLVYSEKVISEFKINSFFGFLAISFPNAILESITSGVVCCLVFTGLFVSNNKKSKLSHID